MATYTRTTPIHADTPLKRLFSRHPLTAYFVLAFGLMWLFALPLAASRNQGSGLLPYDLTETAGNLLYLLATFSGPTVAALIVTGMTEGRAGIKRLRRVVEAGQGKRRDHVGGQDEALLSYLMGNG